MKKIIIAGAGHGGLVAAKLLAQAGFDVTVYEKKAREDLGYDQYDSVHLDGFEKAGVPVPEKYRVHRTGLAFRLPGSDLPALRQGVKDDTFNVEIDRKALYDWLLTPAAQMGVHFEFGCEILSPIVLGSRVAGFETDRGPVYADLVIDAAGIYSPIRSQLPESLGIQNMPRKYELLHPYRAYFARTPGVPDPENVYSVMPMPSPFCGIMWAIMKGDEVDVLIASMEELSDRQIGEKLELLKKDFPQIGEFKRGGRLPDIPTRQPLSMLVADGYAAVGDAAFMTVPLKGSGVGHSMRAGKMLAETVIADKNGFYTRETLWGYQAKFFDDIGFGSALMAVLENEMPCIDAESLEYVFSSGIVSSEMLEQFGSEAGITKILMTTGVSQLTDMTKKIVGHMSLRRTLLRGARNIGRCKLVERGLKNKYDARMALRWAESYDRFFASIRTFSAGQAEKIRTAVADSAIAEEE